MNKEIILYSAQMCGDCQKLRAFLDDNELDYEYRDIKEDPQCAKDVEENTGKLGVPYLVIDGEWVCGYDVGKSFSEEFARGLFGM